MQEGGGGRVGWQSVGAPTDAHRFARIFWEDGGMGAGGCVWGAIIPEG